MPVTFNLQVTNIGKADRVIQFIRSNNFYFGFGKPTGWDSTWGTGITDSNPPSPDPSMTTIPEAFLYKKAKTVLPAVDSDCGVMQFQYCSNINLGNSKYQVLRPDLDPATLSKIIPKYIYLEVDILPSEFTSFRTFGLVLNPMVNNSTPATGLSYTPSQLSDPGALYTLVYGTATTPDPIKQTSLNLLVAI